MSLKTPVNEQQERSRMFNIKSLFSQINIGKDAGSIERKSSLMNMSESGRQLQQFVDRKHLAPIILGELYKQNFLDKWLKGK
jgi:hypothetical protein